MLQWISQGIFRWLEFLLLAVMIGCAIWVTVCAASMAPFGSGPQA